jgi:hypothetical protein
LWAESLHDAIGCQRKRQSITSEQDVHLGDEVCEPRWPIELKMVMPKIIVEITLVRLLYVLGAKLQ